MRSMDSILADEPSVHTLPDGPESDSPSGSSDAAEVETSKGEKSEPVEAKAGTNPGTETVADDDTDVGDPDPTDFSVTGLRKALTAVRGDKRKERKKWQEAERKIAQLEGQITAISQMGARQPEPKAAPVKPGHPDFYASPEDHLSAREAALREEFRAEQFRRDANRSERAMKRQHQDYDQAKAAFTKAAQGKPYLWQEVINDPDPAEFVYAEGKKLLGGGVSDEVTKLRAELEALKAGQANSTSNPKAPVRSIPKSNATARGNGVSVKQAWTGPRSMKEIIGA